jgi:hypothetical protein
MRLRAVLQTIAVGIAASLAAAFATAEERPKAEIVTQLGHSDWVTSVVFAPDGMTALSGGWDNTLRLWDLKNGREIRKFQGHSRQVWSLAVAPDGKTALSGGGDVVEGEFKLWDLTSGREIKTFEGHSALVASVAYSPDGKTVLSGSWDKTLRLWDLASGREIKKFEGHSDNVISVAFLPDGNTVLSGSDDKTLKLWDLASGKELRTFTGPFFLSSVAISPDARTALSGSSDPTLRLWDLATVRQLRTFAGHTGTVFSVAISPDGRTAFSGGVDQTLKLWDLGSGKELRTFSEHSNIVRGVAIGPDGRTLVSGDVGGTLKLWDLSRAVAHRDFEPRVALAQARLKQAAGDPVALATLGDWYAFRGMDHWAVEFLCRARERGAAVAPLTLARCYWNLNRNGEARREFQIALEQSTNPGERTYLLWCIRAIDTEPDRKRRHEALAATLYGRVRRADSLVRSGMVPEAVAEVAVLTKNANWGALEWYDCACVYSLASAKIADKKREYTDRAMELLQKAVDVGWDDAAHVANDTDLDPLRSREDFKKLLADLEKKPAAQPAKEP